MRKRAAAGRGTRRTWAVLWVHANIILATLLAVWWYGGGSVPYDALVYPTCLAIALVSLWLVISWRVAAGGFFDTYAIFLVAAILFNTGQALLEVFHLNRNGLMGNRFPPETAEAALVQILLALLLFHAGGLLALIAQGRHSPPEPPEGNSCDERSRALRLVGWGLIAVSAAPALLDLKRALSLVMAGGYFSLYQQQPDIGVAHSGSIIASFLVPGAVFLLVGSRGRRANIVAAAVIMLLYCVPQLFMGVRGWAVMPVIAFAIAWDRCVRPLPKTFLCVAGGLALLVVFPLVSMLREMPGASRLSPAALVAALSAIDNPAVSVISEMGGTMRTVGHTIALVPAMRPLDHGLSYLYAFSTLFPNLFWDIHPAIARGTADAWVTRMAEPIIAAHGGGLGYSFIAESYLNFGWWGGPLALGVQGFLLALFVRWAEDSRFPARLALVATFTAFFLMYARGESVLLVRSAVWYSLLPYLAVCAVPFLPLGRRRGKGRRRPRRSKRSPLQAA